MLPLVGSTTTPPGRERARALGRPRSSRGRCDPSPSRPGSAAPSSPTPRRAARRGPTSRGCARAACRRRARARPRRTRAIARTLAMLRHDDLRSTSRLRRIRRRLVQRRRAMPSSAEARALHVAHPAIDLHADTLMWSRWFGYDLHDAPRAAAPARGARRPRRRAAHARRRRRRAVLRPRVAPARGARARPRAASIDEQIDVARRDASRAPERPPPRAHRPPTSTRAQRDGAHRRAPRHRGRARARGRSRQRSTHFARRGVRYLGLLHFTRERGRLPRVRPRPRDDEGLTPWGRELVARCEARGRHRRSRAHQPRGFLDACAMAHEAAHRQPHRRARRVRALAQHRRRAAPRRRRHAAACVGVIFCPRYLGGDGLEPVVQHLLHILDVVGEDAPALGSDWDGFIVPTRAAQDPRGLPLLTDALLARRPHRRRDRQDPPRQRRCASCERRE